jgi:hypothetical protein
LFVEEAEACAPEGPRLQQPRRRRQQAVVAERELHGGRAAREVRNGASVEARDSRRSPSATVHSLEPIQAALLPEVVVEVDEVDESDVEDFPGEEPLESPEEPSAPPEGLLSPAELLSPFDDVASLRLSVR